MQMTERAATYQHFGLSTSSTWALPIPRVDVDADRVDVHIHPGPVSPSGHPVWTSRIGLPCSFYSDGDRHAAEWGAAKFGISRHEVTIAADRNDVTLQLLLFPVWAALLALRGRDALHGAVIERDGAGLAIFGESGYGKSTACLRLIDKGWRLVTDDLIAFDERGRVLVGPPFMRLRADLASGRTASADGAGKYRFWPKLADASVPLRAGIILTDRVTEPRPLSAAEAVEGLLTTAYNVFPTSPTQSTDWLRYAVRLARQTPFFGAPPRSLTTEQLLALAGR